MLDLETRPFEARFGSRCPLCGKSWGDPSPCGDSRADRTIQQSLSLLFADRKSKNCEVCDRFIPANRTFCHDCSAARQRYRNAQDRHRRVQSVCGWCFKFFTHRADKHPVTCGYRCMNLKRQHEKRMARAA